MRGRGTKGSLSPWTDGGAADEPWSLPDALRFVRQLATDHYENFPVSFPLFRREQRDALFAVYAFARLADDFADEAPFRTTGGELLRRWEAQLDACVEGDAQSGEARHPVFVALAWAIPRFALDPDLLRALLDAFRQDREKRRYESFDELLDYCRRSANPVGRLVLQVLDADSPAHRRSSDAICTALQLTNFWQDISVDAQKDRIYLPREDLATFGVSEDVVLGEGALPAGTAPLMAHEVTRTRALFELGRPLLSTVPWPGGLYLRAVFWGGTTMLRMVEELHADALRRRPRLSLPPLVASLFHRRTA